MILVEHSMMRNDKIHELSYENKRLLSHCERLKQELDVERTKSAELENRLAEQLKGIGMLSTWLETWTLFYHSGLWLSRWIFKYHNQVFERYYFHQKFCRRIVLANRSCDHDGHSEDSVRFGFDGSSYHYKYIFFW